MSWCIQALLSSIGKKMLMALTGLCFCGFLVMHLLGNLNLFAGKEAFNGYSEKLHSLGGLITIAEFGLLALAVIHIGFGLTLFFQNWQARPSRYAVNKWGGGRTFRSATMPYTGLFLLCFVIFHLINFHFIDKTDTTIYEIVVTAFHHQGYVAFYVLAMVVLAFHVSHGFWSAFQTLGANHPKYMPFIKNVAIVFSFLMVLGFGSLPIYISLMV